MKKWHYLWSFTAIMMLVLSGCGGNSSSGSSGGKADYKEEESFELEGPVTSLNFSLDEKGETLFWGENDGGLSDDKRRNVWVDGEVKSLDMDNFGQFSVLMPSGHIINNDADHDKEVEEKYSIREYDPATEEEEVFVQESDHDDLTHAGFGTYIEDPRTYVHIVTNTDFDDAETYIWDMENDTITDLTFIQDIKEEVDEDELSSYPNFYLNDDASTVYATVTDTGVFAYDVEAKEMETLYSTDNMTSVGASSNALTADGKHLAYGTIEESDGMSFDIIIHALDVESGDTIEIGEGTNVFTLTDGNMMIVDDEEIKKFDFDTEELETVYTISLDEDDEELDNVTISADGSTIAYGYTKKEDDDKQSYMEIVSTN